MTSKYHALSTLLILAIFLTSCGNKNADNDAIATAVAMTVAARDTQAAQATSTSPQTEATPTFTQTAGTIPTPGTSIAPTFSPPTAPSGNGSSGTPCLRASYVSETVPDGTIMQPGETFWKTWTLRNNGSCTWNTAYKIVYSSGELMGGLYEYPMPEVVPPGDTVDISLFLKAPETNGNYSGYWKIQSEWGGKFGLEETETPFYVQINVNDSTSPNYGVTNVTYTIDRDPLAGCATNVWYYVHATISTNGPTTVKYQWMQSDGNESGIKSLEFTQADSITLTRSWSFHLGASPGTKWMQIVIQAPEHQEYPKATFIYDCK